jgi:hypothetical protein
MSSLRKTKNAGKWYRINKLFVNNPDLVDQVEQNADYNAALQTMKGIVASIATQAHVTEPVWPLHHMPCPLAWWQGRLSFDFFSKHTSLTKPTRYVSQHGKDFLNAAKDFRNAVLQVVAVHTMVNDLTQSRDEGDVNPGGVAGDMIGKP